MFVEGKVIVEIGMDDGKVIEIMEPAGTGFVKLVLNVYVVTAPTVKLPGVTVVDLIGFGNAVNVNPEVN